MRAYALRRLILAAPTLLGVTIILFALVRMLPGDAVQQILGEYPGYASDEDALRKELGLDKPIPQQYLSWVGHVVRFDLGESLQTKRPITDELRMRGPVTFELGILAIFLGLCISIPIGVLSALKQDSLADYAARTLSVGMLAIPGFWLATLVITLPSIWWHWTPSPTYTRFTEDPIANLQHMFLPALILATALSGTLMRVTRTEMINVMRQDYIRTARAKGLSNYIVLIRHSLRNAFIPVITVIGLQVPVIIGGSVILENIFTIPGTGRYLLEAISKRDYPVIQGINLLLALVVIFTNIAVDLSYSIIDPRIRYSR
ncbi:MAG TPA: ABC transporter permease [Tepidiformaceae bacterium]|nr:ABC transporter permease [Tepidiformaceae bacterium]